LMRFSFVCCSICFVYRQNDAIYCCQSVLSMYSSQTSSCHSRATKHCQPGLLFDALTSECICLGYFSLIPPLQSS
jgi:hypothetical protein